MDVPINGITMKLTECAQGSYLRIQSETPLRTLNSSPWGGGFGSHTNLINRQVDRFYQAADPIGEMNTFLAEEGIDSHVTASMLTAAKVKHVGFSSLCWEEAAQVELSTHGDSRERLQVASWVTVGLGNKARAGAELPASSLYPGTINSIVIINGLLTDAAMVNAVITATEAKTAALQALGIKVGGAFATGTTTDAVLIAATGRGRLLSYAGTATQLGYLIGRTVYEAVMASGNVYEEKPY
ncbi:adenosylcobinamide amidohydrolase [Paenibacillus sp. SI8]|uniref:adenosylcobinamide amidohydrolase n=1 Tax=unclassified Paenibacillus TaxID=185978 RepID=UPI003464EBEB